VSLKDRVRTAVDTSPGLTDRELTDALVGPSAPQQAVNQAARSLVETGVLTRARRSDGKIGNFATGVASVAAQPDRSNTDAPVGMSEDMVKSGVAAWLERDGWTVDVRWGHERGIDVEAARGNERWVIEAKGCGSRQPMRVNYFIAMLGETLQRMNDPHARYSIALPDMAQYRGLWDRLPRLAKSRTTISLILVGADSTITHLE
jgi:hypothetical protein